MTSSIDRIAVTYIGGPTARLDVAGVRLLTDPTFAHFTENRDAIQRAFDRAQLGMRLHWPERGRTVAVGVSDQTAKA